MERSIDSDVFRAICRGAFFAPIASVESKPRALERRPPIDEYLTRVIKLLARYVIANYRLVPAIEIVSINEPATITAMTIKMMTGHYGAIIV